MSRKDPGEQDIRAYKFDPAARSLFNRESPRYPGQKDIFIKENLEDFKFLREPKRAPVLIKDYDQGKGSPELDKEVERYQKMFYYFMEPEYAAKWKTGNEITDNIRLISDAVGVLAKNFDEWRQKDKKLESELVFRVVFQ
jgi:hypothetical protein